MNSICSGARTIWHKPQLLSIAYHLCTIFRCLTFPSFFARATPCGPVFPCAVAVYLLICLQPFHFCQCVRQCDVTLSVILTCRATHPSVPPSRRPPGADISLSYFPPMICSVSSGLRLQHPVARRVAHTDPQTSGSFWLFSDVCAVGLLGASGEVDLATATFRRRRVGAQRRQRRRSALFKSDDLFVCSTKSFLRWPVRSVTDSPEGIAHSRSRIDSRRLSAPLHVPIETVSLCTDSTASQR